MTWLCVNGLRIVCGFINLFNEEVCEFLKLFQHAYYVMHHKQRVSYVCPGGVSKTYVFRKFSESIQGNICAEYFWYRSSHLKCFNKNNLIKKEALVQAFSCEFCKISKNTFSTEHLGTTASVDSKVAGIRLATLQKKNLNIDVSFLTHSYCHRDVKNCKYKFSKMPIPWFTLQNPHWRLLSISCQKIKSSPSALISCFLIRKNVII